MNAVIRHINQEPVNLVNVIKMGSGEINGLLQVFARLAETRREVSFTNPFGDDEAGTNNTLLLVDSILDGAGSELKEELGSPMRDHIICSSLLKKRRKKMRAHKHKKRLRRNRYKNKP